MKVFRALLWRIASFRDRGPALRARIEGNDPVPGAEAFNLVAPNVSAGAPPRDEDERWPIFVLPGLDNVKLNPRRNRYIF